MINEITITDFIPSIAGTCFEITETFNSFDGTLDITELTIINELPEINDGWESTHLSTLSIYNK